uniref:sphingomyelin phosphodiesterase n=1 Tax=Albugo laibachii Nc14 TaxID=890382 RepID=F0W6C2_9STRA|nr:conserved hypothetical protein [Albugo laibachii Nc14]|eukprot:CCA16666.1 conserved hypothetical protein [Albugo laibachii Nc14]
MSSKTERLAILSFNIFARPEGIHNGEWFRTGDYKDQRISFLLRKLENYDVALLQEMFEIGFRQRDFIRRAYKLGFKYHCGSIWPTITDKLLIDGGLLIISRFPIIERDRITFERGLGADGVCAKGVLYAKIQLTTRASDYIHVFTTHTQAGESLDSWTVRQHQLMQLMSFVKRKADQDRSNPILLTGDFNLDARHNVTHQEKNEEKSVLCTESEVYKQLIHDLSTALDHRDVLDLMKNYNTKSKSEKCVHPITNGNGHGQLLHSLSVKDRYTDGKCIDYMFFCPSKNQNQNQNLEIVKSKTRIDFCGIHDTTSPNQTMPITHISDHYGLSVEFRLNAGDGSGSIEELQKQYPPSLFCEKTPTLWQFKVYALLLLGVVSASGVAYNLFSFLSGLL